MNILVIPGHPHPGSFNHAIADTVCDTAQRNRHRITRPDLCAERFEPCLPADEIPDSGPVPHDIRQHCHDLQMADGIVIVHPYWWGRPPAIRTRWIDRVIRPATTLPLPRGFYGETRS
jgi:NAD(P)H dehydrogenase (quinone)